MISKQELLKLLFRWIDRSSVVEPKLTEHAVEVIIDGICYQIKITRKK